ncbi:hypothetical protein M9458_056416 [Cirrhinus mrigala]|uniref:Uncharacterized protein n=1 Tax=Cirrhinus mrigala TaxID=683832 RepID=A0ABD0MF65_CIRMR
MMLPIAKVFLVVAFFDVTAVFTTVFTATPHKGHNSRIQKCVDADSVNQLREAAQKALDAIGSTHVLSASDNKANRGQHVFNNGLLGFHRSVLQELLKEVGGYDEQLDNLMQDLIMPLNQTQQHAISTMVAYFGATVCRPEDLESQSGESNIRI